MREVSHLRSTRDENWSRTRCPAELRQCLPPLVLLVLGSFGSADPVLEVQQLSRLVGDRVRSDRFQASWMVRPQYPPLSPPSSALHGLVAAISLLLEPG